MREPGQHSCETLRAEWLAPDGRLASGLGSALHDAVATYLALGVAQECAPPEGRDSDARRCALSRLPGFCGCIRQASLTGTPRALSAALLPKVSVYCCLDPICAILIEAYVHTAVVHDVCWSDPACVLVSPHADALLGGLPLTLSPSATIAR